MAYRGIAGHDRRPEVSDTPTGRRDDPKAGDDNPRHGALTRLYEPPDSRDDVADRLEGRPRTIVRVERDFDVMVDADRPGASVPTSAANASSKSPLEMPFR